VTPRSFGLRPQDFGSGLKRPLNAASFGRELGMHAIEHYTELKSVWMNL